MIAIERPIGSDETLIGWLHLMYHMQHLELYTPARASRMGRCKFCPRASA